MNSEPAYLQIAALIRSQIADGTLKPGDSAPSASGLSKLTGHNIAACQEAVRVLVQRGELVRWPSKNSRPVVPGTASDGKAVTNAHELSNELRALRKKAGLMQVELAALIGVSDTAIGHAETGRLWHGRKFWETADAVLDAKGALLRRYAAYKDAATAPTQFPPSVIFVRRPLDTEGIAEALLKAVKIVDETLPWQDDASGDRTELRKAALEATFAKIVSLAED